MKKIFGIIAVIIVAAAGWFYFANPLAKDAHEGQDITDLSNAWLDEGVYQEALQKLKGNPPIEPSLVITPEQTGAKRVAVVFAGMPDRTDTAVLVDLLEKYNMKATFFMEGQNAGDRPEVLKVVLQAGQEVGNYTFVGASRLEKLPQEDVLKDFCMSQKALTVNGAQTVKYAMAPRTQINDSILQAVHAAGIDFWVKPNVLFVPNNIHTDMDADAFVASIPPGSIISFPTGDPVDAVTYEPGKTDERPAVDKKPTIVDNPPVENKVRTEKLTDEIGRVLAALERAGIKAESVGSFRQIKFVPAAAPEVKQK